MDEQLERIKLATGRLEIEKGRREGSPAYLNVLRELADAESKLAGVVSKLKSASRTNLEYGRSRPIITNIFRAAEKLQNDIGSIASDIMDFYE